MFKCLNCGHLFEDGEESRRKDSRGEYFGTPCFEIIKGCPLCGGNYKEVEKCAICGAAKLDEELKGGVCEDCIDGRRTDFECCYKISVGETEEIKINALFATLFDVSDIERILYEYVCDKLQRVDCSQFIDSDIHWFGEKLVKEVKKHENKKE